MDVAQVFRELWRLRLWLIPGVVIAALVAIAIGWDVSLNPPDVKSKNLTIHTADTAVLVDAPTSVLTDIDAPLVVLAARASVYARYMTNLPVRRAIARRMGVSVDRIVAEAPLAQNQPRAAREPVAAQRSEKLLGEQKNYTLQFRTDSGLPTVTILAQAPSTKAAIKLANAGAQGFKDYITRVEDARRVPEGRRVIIRQLGQAEGGSVGKSVKRTGVIAGFIGTFFAWCVLVLLASNVRKSWRQLDVAEQEAAERAALEREFVERE